MDLSTNDLSPKHLYKYRPLSGDGLKYLEGSLLRNEFYFSAATAFNDPFDCVPVLSIHAEAEELRSHLSLLLANDPDRDGKLALFFEAIAARPELWDQRRDEMIRSIVSRLTQDVGVFSMSAVADHILLWSHYGDCHRGVCVRFVTSIWQTFRAVQRVVYAEERPVLNLVRDVGDAMLTKAILTKSHHWAYEQEWRIVIPNRGTPGTGPGVHLFPAEWIDAVILGARISEDDEKRVRAMAAARAQPISLLRARIDDQRFQVVVEEDLRR